MTRTSWKELLEGVGIVAIIISLGLVAYQLRQANDLARLAALESMATTWNTVNIEYFATSGVFVDLMAEVASGSVREDVDASENLRIASALSALDHHWELRYKQVQLGVLDVDDYSFPRVQNPILSSNYHREFWPSLRDGLSEEFAAFWEQRFNLNSTSQLTDD
jgi:hypothetical protein